MARMVCIEKEENKVEIQNIEHQLKEEMKTVIDKVSVSNLSDTQHYIERYFKFFNELSEFNQFREDNIITIGVLDTKATEDNENVSLINKSEQIDEDTNNTELSEIGPDGRKMYKFERNIKAGCLPEIGAYVPESIIRKLNLEHNCYLYAESIGDTYDRHFNYELAKHSNDPYCPNREQINFCLVENRDGFLMINKSYESGDIRIGDSPYSILIKENDIIEFGIRENDIIDVAFPAGKPDEAKVIWKHKENASSFEDETISQKILRSKSKTNRTDFEIENQNEVELTSLENKSVLIIGNERDKAAYKRMIELRGGTFLWADAKDNLTRLESLVRKSDVVIFLLKVSGHIGMEKTKEYCKKYDVPFLTTFSLGKSSIIRMAEEYEHNKENVV